MTSGSSIVNERPLVTVVIPFFNGARFFADAVESVFAQTYDHWELLLVDDGSTDATTEIAKRYAANHPGRVRYLEHPGHANRGASASRNFGSRSATGKYVAFLDADDEWLPGKLEQQVAVLEAHPEVGWVYGRGLWWYGWTGKPEDQHDFVQKLGVAPNSIVRYPELLTLYLQDEDTVPSSFAIMATRELLNGTGGGSEEIWRSVYDDQVAFAKLAMASPVYVQDDTQYRYRQHPDSRCAVTFQAGDYYAIRLPFLEWLRDHLAGHGGTDPNLRTALDLQFGPTYLANGQIDAGTACLRAAMQRSALTRDALEKLFRAVVHGAISSIGPAPVQFVREVFARLPATPEFRALRTRLLGAVNAEVAVRHHRAGEIGRARRHAWRAVMESPSSVRHHGIIRIAMECVIGVGLTDRVRALVERRRVAE
jgi:glycosyltransferase involved in cell wall biosynthesis